MNKHFKLKTSLILAGMLALPMAQAASIAKTDYNAGKTSIAADYKADSAACASLAGNSKDICVEQAKGRQKVALAELEYAHTGKPADQTKVRVAKAESAYAVAKERCDDLAGNVKDVCVTEAKSYRGQGAGRRQDGQGDRCCQDRCRRYQARRRLQGGRGEVRRAGGRCQGQLHLERQGKIRQDLNPAQ